MTVAAVGGKRDFAGSKADGMVFVIGAATSDADDHREAGRAAAGAHRPMGTEPAGLRIPRRRAAESAPRRSEGQTKNDRAKTATSLAVFIQSASSRRSKRLRHDFAADEKANGDIRQNVSGEEWQPCFQGSKFGNLATRVEIKSDGS